VSTDDSHFIVSTVNSGSPRVTDVPTDTACELTIPGKTART
jgi:hypothetical protein